MTDVPSNLIPTRVTQLPTAPVASEDSWLMCVYQGNSYKVRAGDLVSVTGVPVTRQVIAGTGLSGGGQLTDNVTLSVAVGGIGYAQLAVSGVTPSTYGSSTQIPVLTIDATGRVTAATTTALTVSGYVPESRQVIAGTGLSGGGALNANVTISANLSDSTPLALNDSGTSGVSTSISRSDHKHPAVTLSSASQVSGILGLSNGGTAKSLTPVAGGILWSGADGLYIGPAGTSGQVLTSAGSGQYTWSNVLLVVPQPANYVYAGPTSGGSAATSFRLLVNADLPDSGVSANSYGSGSLIPVVTVNAKGVITSVTTTGLNLSSPPAIGGTTPAAITGTTITATKYVGINGGTF